MRIWPLWQEKRLTPEQVTLPVYELIQAFSDGYEKWHKANKDRGNPSPDAEIMGNPPQDLLEFFGAQGA